MQTLNGNEALWESRSSAESVHVLAKSVCDHMSLWETVLREKGCWSEEEAAGGKFGACTDAMKGICLL